MFADMITAPPKQEELAPGQTMPESTPPPAAPPPPPAAPPAPPPKSDTPQLEKQETPKLEVPPKTAATQTKKEEPKTEAAAEKDEELDLPEEEFEARLAGITSRTRINWRGAHSSSAPSSSSGATSWKRTPRKWS